MAFRIHHNKGMFDVRHVSDTNMTRIDVISFNNFTFSNYYWCRGVNVYVSASYTDTFSTLNPITKLQLFD